jgi:parvulin-like peptidyl-prolyl isomerase
MMPIVKYFILPLLLLVPRSGQSEERVHNTQNIIVQIEPNYTISFEELQNYVYEHQYNYRFRKNKSQAYEKAIEDMIVRQLKIIDFFSLELQKNTALLQNIRRTINEELVIHYYNTRFYAKYINDESMQYAYKDMGKEVVYQQIVLAKPKDASKKTIDSLKSVARDIEAKIRHGADFDELVKRYSQDVESSRRGGLMPLLDWKTSLSSNFHYIVFHMAVDDARVVESSESIHIVKVAKINTKDVPSYDNVKEDIRKTLHERYADFCLQEFERAKKNLVDEKTLKWNQQAIHQLVRWSTIPNFYQTHYSDTLQYAISHGKNFLIVKHSNGIVDLKEYLRLLNEVLTWSRVPSKKEDDIKDFILEAVRTDRIVRKARELDLEKDIFNSRTTNLALRDAVVRLYNRQMIDAQIPKPTERALEDFYAANKDSLFYQLAKVNIYAVIDSNKSRIVELIHKLDQNTPFEKLAPEILVKTFIRKRDGTLDTFLEDEPPFLGEAAFKLKLLESAGPIEYNDPGKGKQYALIKCMATREEKQLSFKDVEKTIATEFTNYYWEKLNKATQEQLKKKYVVTVYQDVLKKNLSSLGINP